MTRGKEGLCFLTKQDYKRGKSKNWGLNQIDERSVVRTQRMKATNLEGLELPYREEGPAIRERERT